MNNTISLQTNVPEFFNDISEEIRLFVPTAEIVLEDRPDCKYKAIVTTELGRVWKASTLIYHNSNAVSSYEFEYPCIEGDSITVKRHLKRCVKISVFRAMHKLYPDAFVPWGSLTGIRPTKLLRDLEDETSPDTACNTMLKLFEVSQSKYDIAKAICDVQRPIIQTVTPHDVDIYIGIPYCKTKCLYCSFPSDIRTAKTDMRPYLDTLKRDIKLGAELLRAAGFKVRSFYMGGGTPTVLTAPELEEILLHAYNCYGTFGQEFTIEAGRPDTITSEKLQIMRSFGASRVSINPQTMNQKTLDLIGRSHTVKSIIDVFELAHSMGFDINMDIITCLPGESVLDVKHTLDCIESLAPENITVHTLALKRSSKLKQIAQDITDMMPSSKQADIMVAEGLATAKRLSMQPYYMYRQKYMSGNLENIGYAIPGKECIYNVDMMEETVSIMAHGAGSMTKRVFNGRTLRVERIPNPKDIATYIEKLPYIVESKHALFNE